MSRRVTPAGTFRLIANMSRGSRCQVSGCAVGADRHADERIERAGGPVLAGDPLRKHQGERTALHGERQIGVHVLARDLARIHAHGQLGRLHARARSTSAAAAIAVSTPLSFRTSAPQLQRCAMFPEMERRGNEC